MMEGLKNKTARRYRRVVRELKTRFEFDVAAEQGIEPPGSTEGPAGGRPLSPVPPRPQHGEARP